MIVLLLVGGAVSLAGPVGFVGLMVPHVGAISRRTGPSAGDSRLRAVRGAR